MFPQRHKWNTVKNHMSKVSATKHLKVSTWQSILGFTMCCQSSAHVWRPVCTITIVMIDIVYNQSIYNSSAHQPWSTKGGSVRKLTLPPKNGFLLYCFKYCIKCFSYQINKTKSCEVRNVIGHVRRHWRTKCVMLNPVHRFSKPRITDVCQAE